MKKVLLGTSALVAAAVISSPASANVELKITGAVDWQTGLAVSDTAPPTEESRSYDMSTDWDMTLTSTGTTDNGLTYGTVLNLDDTGGASIAVDEAFVYVSGDFGRVALGDDDPAAAVLRYMVEAVGSGLADGDYANYITDGSGSNGTGFVHGGDDTKIVYTGGVGGFNFGLSFSPTDAGNIYTSPTGDMDQSGTAYENVFSVGANYAFEFDGGSIGFSGGVNYGGNENSAEEDLLEWGIGTKLATGGFGLQGFFVNSGDHTNDANGVQVQTEGHSKWGAGVSYSMDGIKFAANYLGSSFDEMGMAESGTTHAVGGGAAYSLAPGLSVYGEVVYQTYSAKTDISNDATIVLIGASASY